MDLLTLLIIFFVLGGLITAAIAIAVEVKKHRPVKAAPCADGYLVAEDTRMATTEDTFLRTHTTRIKVSSSKPAKR